MVTEIGARDLGDHARYNMLEVLFISIHLPAATPENA